MPAEPTTTTPIADSGRGGRFRGKIRPRVKTPTLIQIEAVECGAVALAIILRHFKKYVAIEEIRSACDISRSGSSALKILKAARSYGLLAQGWKKDTDELGDLPLPFVAFWNFSHFVVVEGFRTDSVYLNDPKTGPRRVSMQEFQSSYTGVALEIAPGPSFQPGGHAPNLLRSLIERLPPASLAPLVFLVICGLALSVTGLITPSFQRVFVDDYLIDGQDSWVRAMLWIVLAAAGVTALLKWLERYVLVRFSTILAARMEGSFLWHTLRLPVLFFQQRFAGELARRTTINDQVASILSGRLANAVTSLITIFPYAIVLLTYNWSLALVGLSIACLNIISIGLINRARVDSNSQLLQDQGVLTGTAITGFQSIESIKASAGEDAFFNRLTGTLAKIINTHQRLAIWSLGLSLTPKFLDHLNSAAMLTLGGLAIIDGHFTIGALLAFQSLMSAFMAPFSSLAGLGGELQTAEGQINRLDDVLVAKLDSHIKNALPDPEGDTVPRLQGRIEVRNLTFGYSVQEPPLLKNLSFTIEPGRRTAIVGSSGSGKSTLVQLVAGVLEPWSGEVLFDGKSRSAWPRKTLARSLSLVAQDIHLFEGTVAQNIALFDSSVPMVAIERAATDACIAESILERPGGYFAQIGEAGRNFSGGERQRIEIARALALNGSMLILDEATSALDPETELRIDSNIRQRGTTCLISAHRLSTIRDADEIIVLEQGAIAERGTHDELVAANGVYARFLEG
jgi:NHLM bacteriocin system ABC transporter peptidase/ATP-binding protein